MFKAGAITARDLGGMPLQLPYKSQGPHEQRNLDAHGARTLTRPAKPEHVSSTVPHDPVALT